MQDAVQRAHEEQIVSGSLRALERAMAGNVVDYASWDDAVRNLVLAFDRAWAARNIGPTIKATLDYDVSLVIGGDDRPLYGQLDGAENAARAMEILGSATVRLVDRARR